MTDLSAHCVAAYHRAQDYGLELSPTIIHAIATITHKIQEGDSYGA